MAEKILVIEDDLAINEYAVMVLRKEAYEVRTAYDGKEGLDIARTFKPDLVVLDLMMPVMHGYEVLERLREDLELNKVQVLITSTKCYDERKAAAADGYLVKPYTAQTLAVEVKKLLG